MGEGIDRDHLAVAHRRDQDQDIPVEIPEDILLRQGQGKGFHKILNTESFYIIETRV